MKPELLNVLACPICKSGLRYDKQAQELICKADRLAFPIKEGIPHLLPEAATEIEESTKP